MQIVGGGIGVHFGPERGDHLLAVERAAGLQRQQLEQRFRFVRLPVTANDDAPPGPQLE